MPVGVVLDFKGASIDQYEQIQRELNAIPGGPMPDLAKGGIFHWVTQTDDGFKAVDVWETREDFENFVRNTIAPTAQKIGLPNQPEITFYEIYNYHN
jgi:hypothetical protein